MVLLCAHNEEGSFGFVLNRFIDMAIGDLMDDMPPSKSRISIGGPVQSSNLYYLHTLGKHIEGSVAVLDDIQMGGDFDQLRAVLTADPKLAKHVRFFVGYSGWSEGQLEKELGQRSWLVHPADKRRVMNTSLKDLWGDTLRGMGKAFAPLANFPRTHRTTERPSSRAPCSPAGNRDQQAVRVALGAVAGNPLRTA
ncbi:MAG: YqgE/AlgH family protein [Flavobacteriales bacterium]|nr:YqgE/AlgH family protein [Flavobacteriales bacterium]